MSSASINTLDYGDRVRLGKEREVGILERANRLMPGTFTPSTKQEDMSEKIDAWWTYNGTVRSVQIKTRDKRSDLGLSIIKDYRGLRSLKKSHENGTIEWDRDWTKVDNYLFLDRYNGLYLVSGEFAHNTCAKMLEEFLKLDEFDEGDFTRRSLGSQFKFVKGKVNSQESMRIICYITTLYLTHHGKAKEYRD